MCLHPGQGGGLPLALAFHTSREVFIWLSKHTTCLRRMESLPNLFQGKSLHPLYLEYWHGNLSRALLATLKCPLPRTHIRPCSRPPLATYNLAPEIRETGEPNARGKTCLRPLLNSPRGRGLLSFAGVSGEGVRVAEWNGTSLVPLLELRLLRAPV